MNCSPRPVCWITKPFFVGLLVFHVLKYVHRSSKAQIGDDRNFGLITAVAAWWSSISG